MSILIILNKLTLKDVYPEIAGFALDLFILGIILNNIESRIEKKDKIEKYIEQIDDYRNWDSEQAARLIAGNIRRLSKEGKNKIDASFCYLANAKLDTCNLENYIFNYSYLKQASLKDTNLIRAKLRHTDLSGAFLNRANCSEADFYNATLNDACLFDTLFIKANLTDVFLHNVQINNNTSFGKADLSYARVDKDFLQNICDLGVGGAKEIAEKYECKFEESYNSYALFPKKKKKFFDNKL